MKNNNDLARHRKVLEYCNHYKYLTDGKENDYDNKTGYCATHCPAYITVDLEAIYAIKQISFQLWDYEDPKNKLSNKSDYSNQRYAYRLLCSTDRRNWQIIYDTAEALERYCKGWQTFKMDKECEARYIRIHAVNNLRNSGFHVVRMHAFLEVNTLFDSNKVVICNESFDWEIGDAYPIANQLLDLSGRIQNLMPKKMNNDLRKKHTVIIDYLFEKSKELDSVDGKIDEIRKLIAEPISEKFDEEFRKNSKSSIIGLIITAVSFIVWLTVMLK